MKILVIDDQQLIRLSIERRLSTLGYHVETAKCAKMGASIFDLFAPDLVVLDIDLPTTCGLSMVMHVRKNRNSKTPILVISGNTNEDTIMEAFHYGIDDYMKKPVNATEVASKIKNILGCVPIPHKRKISS